MFEKGLIFRNWEFPDGVGPDGNGYDGDCSGFLYYGKVGRYHWVEHALGHDSPILYLIDKDRLSILEFYTGWEEPFTTETNSLLVVLRSSELAQKTPLLRILGVHAEKYYNGGYKDEFVCDAPDWRGDQKSESFYAKMISLSDDAIAVEVKVVIPSPGKSVKNDLGVMRLVRDGQKWRIVEPETLWPQITCH